MCFFNKILFSFYLNNLNFYNDRNLISDLMKQFGLIWRGILKDMKFLIFRDFFLNFFEFNIDLFLFSLAHAARVRKKKKCATWRHMRLSRVHVCACASARVCACAHVCALVCD